ncbi:hypothetical protein, conserved [Eimeria tenella]|uniref:Uncharacterized protein n=1 Tax=Eimeria tenella TaxID=5802 RepID=H9B9D3_EIMTE|nr:hypothetical protein, conserved [Eimeria tenella]AET50593.1 hypothetical protein [Eimeria tenella]CDJ40455.1 hypothetical protein, conserved [Eimeria tenella]|eukprot:XP_013231205.1 hypothetical protein, conserved [Eimeria tenella]
MAWNNGAPKEAVSGEGQSTPSPSPGLSKAEAAGAVGSMVHVEQPLGALDGTYKEVFGMQSPPRGGIRKASVAPSPGATADWQAPQVYNFEVPYALQPFMREGPHGGFAPARVYDTPLQSQMRGRQGSITGGSATKWWLLMLMTLNTLASCWGLWELRQRTAQVIHAQEVALGDLTETIRSRLLPVFDHGFFPELLSPSPMESLTRQLFYEWAGAKEEPGVAQQEEVTTKKGKPPRLPLQGGAVEPTRHKRSTPLPDFLLSPTIAPGPSLGFNSPVVAGVEGTLQSPVSPKWSTSSEQR